MKNFKMRKKIVNYKQNYTCELKIMLTKEIVKKRSAVPNGLV